MNRKILGVLVLISIVCSLDLFMKRFLAEEKYRQIGVFYEWNEICNFEKQNGISQGHFLQEMKKNKISGVGLREDSLDTLNLEGKLKVLKGFEVDPNLSLEFKFNPDYTYCFSKDHALLKRISERFEKRYEFKSQLYSDFLEIHAQDRKMDAKTQFKFYQTDSIIHLPLEYDENKIQYLTSKGFRIVFLVSEGSGENPKALKGLLDFLPFNLMKNYGMALVLTGNKIPGLPTASLQTAMWMNRLFMASGERIKLGILEFSKQDGQDKFHRNLSPRNIVRTHTITNPETLVNEPHIMESRFLRAVRERNIRLLYLRFFYGYRKGYPGESSYQQNCNFQKRLIQKLESHNYEMVNHLSSFERIEWIKNQRYWIIPGVIAVIILLLSSFFNFVKESQMFYFTIMSVFWWLGYQIVGKENLFLITALASACVFPSMAALGLFKIKMELNRKSLYSCFIALSKGVLISFAGAVCITGLLSNSEYMLKIRQFAGIKIAFLFPLFIIILKYIQSENFNNFWSEILSQKLEIKHLMLFIAGMGAIGYYILRSSNSAVIPVSGIELKSRELLEELLWVRPRTKEFLIGYPAIYLIPVIGVLGIQELILPVYLFSTMGFVSLANSFCHLHTALDVTLIRSFHGFILGNLNGIILMILGFLLILFLKRRNRVSICGYYGFDNFGDDAILSSIVQTMRKLQPDVDITVYSNNPQKTSQIYQVDSVNRYHPLSILKSAFNTRTFIFGGGGLLQDTTSLKSLLYYLLMAFFHRICGCRVIVYGQGIGPLRYRISKILTKLLLKISTAVIVRDLQSWQKASEWVNTKVYLGPDTVFLLDREEVKPVIEKVKSPVIGISLRPWKDQQHFIEEFRKFASLVLTKTQWNISLFPFQENEDYPICKEIADNFQDEPRISLPQKYSDYKELTQHISEVDLMIGMRFHSLVFSLIESKPIYGIIYDPKVESLLFQGGFMGCQVNEINAELMFEDVQTIINNPDDYQLKARNYLKKMKIRGERTLTVLNRVIFNRDETGKS